MTSLITGAFQCYFCDSLCMDDIGVLLSCTSTCQVLLTSGRGNAGNPLNTCSEPAASDQAHIWRHHDDLASRDPSHHSNLYTAAVQIRRPYKLAACLPASGHHGYARTWMCENSQALAVLWWTISSGTSDGLRAGAVLVACLRGNNQCSWSMLLWHVCSLRTGLLQE